MLDSTFNLAGSQAMCAGVLPLVTPALRFVPEPNVARCNLPSHSSTTTVFSGSQLTSHPFKMSHTQGFCRPCSFKCSRGTLSSLYTLSDLKMRCDICVVPNQNSI